MICIWLSSHRCVHGWSIAGGGLEGLWSPGMFTFCPRTIGFICDECGGRVRGCLFDSLGWNRGRLYPDRWIANDRPMSGGRNSWRTVWRSCRSLPLWWNIGREGPRSSSHGCREYCKKISPSHTAPSSSIPPSTYLKASQYAPHIREGCPHSTHPLDAE